jgi:hypothetical protein
MKSFGCELHPFAPLLMAGHLVPAIPQESLLALEPMDLALEGMDQAEV